MTVYLVYQTKNKLFGVFSNKKLARAQVETLKAEGKTAANYEPHQVWKR